MKRKLKLIAYDYPWVVLMRYPDIVDIFNVLSGIFVGRDITTNRGGEQGTGNEDT